MMAFGADKSGSTFPTELELGRVIGVTICTAHETLFTVFALTLSGEVCDNCVNHSRYGGGHRNRLNGLLVCVLFPFLFCYGKTLATVKVMYLRNWVSGGNTAHE
jgi:hypothetical protein